MFKGVSEEDKKRIEDITECLRKLSRPVTMLRSIEDYGNFHLLIFNTEDYKGFDLKYFRRNASEGFHSAWFGKGCGTLYVTITKTGRDAISLSKLPEEDKQRLRNIANDLAKHIEGRYSVYEVDETHVKYYIFWMTVPNGFKDDFDSYRKDLETTQDISVFRYTASCRVSVPRVMDPLLVVVDIYYNALQELTFVCLDASGLHVNKTYLPKDVCVLSFKGLRYLQNIRQVPGGFKTDDSVFVAPLERNWTFTYRSGALCLDKPCARMTDAQHKSSMMAWIARLDEKDTERALAHLMDTQQYQAADVMVEMWFQDVC